MTMCGVHGDVGEVKRCVTCQSERGRARRLRLPDVVRKQETNAYLRRMYNITLVQYDELLEAQGRGCAICGGTNPRVRLFVDHDHSCCPGSKSCGDCVRGLLCYGCNTGMGFYDRGFMEKAQQYTSAQRMGLRR